MSKISIITVNFNNKQGLAKTIESVLAQKECDYEYLVIDGGSTDGSADVIKKNNDQIAYWVSERDTGIYDAMNKGIARANGQYLMFLNSGDYLVDDKVMSRCLLSLKRKEEIDILYGNVLLDVEKNGCIEKVVYSYPATIDLKFLTISTINHQASLIKASLFEEYGPYPQNYKIASDYWMFLKCFLMGKRYGYFNDTLVKYDTTGLSATEDYKSYLAEKKVIWDALVPDYAKVIYGQYTELEKLVANHEYWLNFWLVRAAVKFMKTAKAIKRKMRA